MKFFDALAKKWLFWFFERWLVCRQKPNVPFVRWQKIKNTFISKIFIYTVRLACLQRGGGLAQWRAHCRSWGAKLPKSHCCLRGATPAIAPNRSLGAVHFSPFSLFVFKPYFQFPIIVFHAFVALVVEEQAKRQTICVFVFDYASTTFSVIGASRFRTSTLFYIFAIQFFCF